MKNSRSSFSFPQKQRVSAINDTWFIHWCIVILLLQSVIFLRKHPSCTCTLLVLCLVQQHCCDGACEIMKRYLWRSQGSYYYLKRKATLLQSHRQFLVNLNTGWSNCLYHLSNAPIASCKLRVFYKGTRSFRDGLLRVHLLHRSVFVH